MRSVLGIQIQDEMAQLVQLDVSKRQVCAVIPIPVQEQSNRGSLDDPESLAIHITESLNSAQPKIKKSPVHVCLGEQVVFRKILEVPVMQDTHKLHEKIIAEVAAYLPEDVEVMEIVFQPVPGTAVAHEVVIEAPVKPENTKTEKAAKKPKKETKPQTKTEMLQQVVVVAVPRNIVQEWLVLCEVAKLELRVLEPRANAMARLAVPLMKAEPFIMIDHVRTEVTVCVVHGGVVWATTVVQLAHTLTTEEVVELIADECSHLEKLYSNRLSSTATLKQALLFSSAENAKELRELLHKAVTMPINLADTPLLHGVPSEQYGAIATAIAPEEVYA